MVPGKVPLDQKVVLVSAGDSHTAALTDDGTVFIWGAFRVSHTSHRNESFVLVCEQGPIFS